MFFRPADRESRTAQGGPGAALAMTLCAVLVVVSGVIPDPIQIGANSASRSIFVTGRSAQEPATGVATRNPDKVEGFARRRILVALEPPAEGLWRSCL